MSWQAVTLTYRARSPLLLGRYPLGFIQRTRTFIPGWTLWGALTATLTRACFPQADGARYEAVGAWVEHNLLTSYAYLLVEGGLAAPHFRDGGWYYGPLPATQFEARFVTSLGQTAVAPGSLTAETNTLHETETLSPYDLATGEPARWRFTLYQRGSEEVSQSEDEVLAALTPEALLAALRTLVVGADRSAGLGRLELETAGAWQAVAGNAWPVPLDRDGPTLRAHVRVADLDGNQVRGRAEVIPWRWWKNTPDPDGRSWGPGQQQSVQCCYVPGCEVADDWQPVVGPWGFWQAQHECGA